MPVPDYQSFMRPILEVAASGQEWRTGDLKDAVADHAELSEDDRSELLPSGKQMTYANRIGWAKTYLTKAGLLEAPQRGLVRITDQGRQAVKSGAVINNEYLKQFESFRTFKARGSEGETESESFPSDDDDVTPDERFDKLYRTIRSALAQELLDMVVAASPAFFERLVVELLVAMGYGGSVADAGRAIGRSGDNGIDGIIKQDRLGIDNVYIQAKRWSPDRTVGAGEVRDLAGALSMRRSTKGVLITTSDFTTSAVDTARQVGNIVLVNGERLAELMIDHNVGVSTGEQYELKKIDQDYFEEA